MWFNLFFGCRFFLPSLIYFLEELGNSVTDRLAVVRISVPLIKGVAIFSFLTDRAVDSGCRLSTKVERMSSTNFSVVENQSGEASKIYTSPGLYCSKSLGTAFFLHTSRRQQLNLLIAFGPYAQLCPRTMCQQ